MWWAVAAAMAGEPALEIGGSFGVIAAQAPAQDALTSAFYGAPRLGLWPGARAGVEIELGITSGPSGVADAGMSGFAPRAQLAVHPLGDAVAGPRLFAGLGVDVQRHHGAMDVDGLPGVTTPWRTVGLLAVGGLGLDARIAGALRLRVDVGGLVILGHAGEPKEARVGLTATAGIAARFPVAADRDKDRIRDRDDACPDEAEDVDGFQDEDGCRDRDNDLDGVRDELDACPLDAEDLDGDRDEDGCPEG